MPVDKMPVDKLPVDKMPVDKMPVDKMQVDKMTWYHSIEYWFLFRNFIKDKVQFTCPTKTVQIYSLGAISNLNYGGKQIET